MASSLQALLNVIKNATTREQPARNIEDLEEEEEELEKEGNVLTSTGNTKGAPTLTATGTSSNGDSNVGGLRRSTRAASKTPADPNISKGATVPTPDPTEHGKSLRTNRLQSSDQPINKLEIITADIV
ncbi:hypothetical protein KEM48_008082 [Puccinia striiformis f. sp. tritici PST-130]|nr:hypothetical protein KEM48_008082 [Puccinia striiformis f. sp. tritici PST-130]